MGVARAMGRAVPKEQEGMGLGRWDPQHRHGGKDTKRDKQMDRCG